MSTWNLLVSSNNFIHSHNRAMLQAFRIFLEEWRNYRSFSALVPEKRKLVFYSEGPESYPHFAPILTVLYRDHGQHVIYLTSHKQEYRRLLSASGITPFYIGTGAVRTLLFALLKADVMVMTMPDLHTFHIKRSKNPVHYVYVHHSIVSCHMIYRPTAFDNFDTILCVGPHHIQEIRTRETAMQLKAKHLVEQGYGRLDTLLAEYTENGTASGNHTPIKVLIAPSWGANALIERHGGAFIRPLLEEGMHITLRPHPQTRKSHATVLKAIRDEFSSYSNFSYEESVISTANIHVADIMISDWSGAAIEFAFSRLRPVLFVDVPRKVNNPGYEEIGIEPMEVSIREAIGMVMPEESVLQMSTYIYRILDQPDVLRSSILASREKYIYHIGKSGHKGAESLMHLLKKEKSTQHD
jgi:hypothetical protein